MKKKYIEVSEVRYFVPKDTSLQFFTKQGSVDVVDYSNSGFLLRCSNHQLSVGQDVRVSSVSIDGEELPISPVLLPIQLEVVWSKPTSKSLTFEAGVRIKGQNSVNKEFLCDLLRDYFDEPEVAVEELRKVG